MSFVFDSAKENIFKDRINLNNDSFRVHLVTAVPDSQNSSVVSHISDVEYAHATYSPQDLPEKEVRFDSDNSTVSLNGDNVTFAGLDTDDGTQIVGMVVSRVDADSSKQYLVCYNDFTQNYTPNTADLTVEVPNAGILKAQ